MEQQQSFHNFLRSGKLNLHEDNLYLCMAKSNSIFIANNYFKEEFLVLPNTNSIILGNLFFKNNSIELYPRENLMKLPDLTLQLNEISTQADKIGKPQYTIRTSKKCVIAPNQQTTLKCNLESKNKIFADVCGIVEPKVCFEE